MDDNRRKYIYNDAAKLYNELKNEVLENPEDHFNKKYRSNITKLHAYLEQAQDEFRNMKAAPQKKGFKLLEKLPIKQPVSQLDVILGKLAVTATQLRICKSCKCLHCEKDNCKGSCFVCPAQSKITYCDEVLCIRECENWNIMMQGKQYEVLYMVYIFKSEHFYIYISTPGDSTVMAMVYNIKLGTVKYPTTEHTGELNTIANALTALNSEE